MKLNVKAIYFIENYIKNIYVALKNEEYLPHNLSRIYTTSIIIDYLIKDLKTL